MYIESLTNTRNTNFSLGKETRNIQPPEKDRGPLREADGTWARRAADEAEVFAEH